MSVRLYIGRGKGYLTPPVPLSCMWENPVTTSCKRHITSQQIRFRRTLAIAGRESALHFLVNVRDSLSHAIWKRRAGKDVAYTPWSAWEQKEYCAAGIVRQSRVMRRD